MNEQREIVAAEPPLNCLVGPLPMRIISCGGWLCNGQSGQICDWEMSDGTVKTLSMREVEAIRANI